VHRKKVQLPFLTWRRRRLLYSSWVRLSRWEFWPPWAAYAPVLCYVLGLAARHRSLTVFTAANPAIPAGGFIGESKFDILRGLGPGSVARSLFLEATLPAALKIERVEAFRSSLERQLPIVVKPDQGQRGSGVIVARTREALHRRLTDTQVDTIVQEYVPGSEFGVFYVRRPGDSRGRILSITEKRLPSVIGDGRSTLEELILKDPDTIGMARFHLRQHADRLREVPLPAQIVSLGDCASHCRGARFYNAGTLLTPALERAIDDIAARFHGFSFGRFDLRVPSREALSRGEDITILELNGVTSEVTHIYDPGVSLIEAYRALFAQWRLAFEIGAENAANGARVWSLAELIERVAAHAASQRAEVSRSRPRRSPHSESRTRSRATAPSSLSQ
jgi:ribosomal protein S6-L-glutamate ligase RimK-like protein